MKAEVLRIAIPLFVVSMVLFGIMSARIKPMKPSKRLSTLYLIIAGLVFGLMSLIGFAEAYLSLNFTFAIVCVYLLSLGIANLILATKMLPWFEDVNFLFGLVFTLITALIGSMLYLFGYYYLTGMGVNLFYFYSLPFFFMPFIIFKAFIYFYEIPKKQFKKWYYPFGKEINDPSEREMQSPLVVAFVFQKRFDINELTTFRAKAPRNMKFGKLFYYFIGEYNTQHSDSKIEYIYDRSKSYGWIFYIKPTWIGKKIYIDPDKTVSENLIEENSIIIATRVLE